MFVPTDLLMVLMVGIWGFNFPVVKYATRLMPPLAFNAVRITLAAIVLLAFARATVRERPTPRQVLLLLALGVLGNGIYQMVFVGSVVNTDVGVAALLLASSPAFIALLSRFAGLGPITSRCAIGIALSLAGVALIALTSRTAMDGSSSIEGNLLSVLAAMIWAVYVVLQAKYANDVEDTTVAALTLAGGALPLLLFGFPSMLATHWSALPRGRVARDSLRRCDLARGRIGVLVSRHSHSRRDAHRDLSPSRARVRADRGVDLDARASHGVAGRGRRHHSRGRHPDAHLSDASKMKLVLFDIDGTILWSDGAGRRAMTEALTNVFGGAGPTDYHYDGKTDPQIVRDLMRASGHTDETIDERIAPLIERYLGGLERELAAARAPTCSTACASCWTSSRRAATSCSDCSRGICARAPRSSCRRRESTSTASECARSDRIITRAASFPRSHSAERGRSRSGDSG